MDFFGYTLWTGLFMGEKKWLDSLELGSPEDFDPEEDLWEKLFAGLERILTESHLLGKVGGCLHISSEIARLSADVENFQIFPKYIEARKKFESQIPFELGVHIGFSRPQYPLQPKFKETLLADLANASKLGATSIVCHPPSLKKASFNPEFMNRFIEELLDEEICLALREHKVGLMWENMISGHYASLKHLVLFRENLTDALIKKGFEDLVEKHQFCLDTGHLLIWMSRTRQKAKRKKEIDLYLPQFAKNLKIFHIHANDGTRDHHVIPGSIEYLKHPSRKRISRRKFLAKSKVVEKWIKICNANKVLPQRHIHLETTTVPFSIKELVKYAETIKRTLN